MDIKRVFSCLVLVAMLFGQGNTNIYATESIEEQNSYEYTEEITYEDAKQIFNNNGYTEEIFNIYDENLAIDLAYEMRNNPDSVMISSTVTTFDELEGISILVNSSKEELMKYYEIDKDAVDNIKAELQLLSELSEEEFCEKFETTKAEAHILNQILSEDSNYSLPKEIDPVNELHLDSVISSSDLRFTQTIRDHSSSSASKFCVIVDWRFLTAYYPYDFTDKVVVAWGGTLVKDTTSSSDRSVYYYDMNGTLGNFGWGSWASSGTPYISESGQNYDIYSFPTAKGLISKARSGSVYFYIKNNSKTGDYVNVMSQYCHKKLSIGGGSIDISGTPSISVGYAYNVSDLANTTQTIQE